MTRPRTARRLRGKWSRRCAASRSRRYAAGRRRGLARFEGSSANKSVHFSSPLPLAGEGRGGGNSPHRLATRAPSPTLPRKREREQKSCPITGDRHEKESFARSRCRRGVVRPRGRRSRRGADAHDARYLCVDVEGGNATLYVPPSGESVLIDTG